MAYSFLAAKKSCGQAGVAVVVPLGLGSLVKKLH